MAHWIKIFGLISVIVLLTGDRVCGNERFNFIENPHEYLPFGSNNADGFTAFLTADTVNPYIPPVVFTGFRIYKQPGLFNAAGLPENRHVNEFDTIRLSYLENQFTVEYTAFDHADLPGRRYSHKLENFSNDWITSGAFHTASFAHLNPGKYIFRVRRANNEGIWEDEVAALTIIIKPPPWMTWWAYAVYGLAGITLLLTLRRYELSRIRMRLDLRVKNNELKLARAVQKNLLPNGTPDIKGYDIAGRNIPAQMLGGDYYDFIQIDNHRIALTLGDVSGKGLAAALLMANLQGTLRAKIFATASVSECMRQTNRMLYRSSGDDRFFTCVLGVLDIQSHEFTYCNAGHDHPVFMNSNDKAKRLHTDNTILGILDDHLYNEKTVLFKEGSILVMFSDGIVETKNASGNEFGDDRLIKVIKKYRDKPAEVLTERIISAASAYAGNTRQTDDITLIVIKRNKVAD